MNAEKKSRIRNVSNEPYPVNLLLTVNENSVYAIDMVAEDITQKDIDELLCAMAKLSERECEMLRLRFEERYLLKEIGDVFNISAERVRRVLYTSMRKLRPSLSILRNNEKQRKPLRKRKEQR